MRRLRIILSIGLVAIFYSCDECAFVKEEDLGNNFKLSEFNNVERNIRYSEEKCSNSGIEIVPMTVTQYAYDKNWIIAKSSPPRSGGLYQYWIINKSQKVKLIRENDSTFEALRSKVYGPFDSASFAGQLESKNIILSLKKI